MSDFLQPVDASPPVSSVHEDSPGKNTEVDCHAFLQRIFPTQVSHIVGGFFTIWATREDTHMCVCVYNTVPFFVVWIDIKVN